LIRPNIFTDNVRNERDTDKETNTGKYSSEGASIANGAL